MPSAEEIAQTRIRQVTGEHSLALDLSGPRLAELPEEVRNLTWLEQLHLNKMGLTLLPLPGPRGALSADGTRAGHRPLS